MKVRREGGSCGKKTDDSSRCFESVTGPLGHVLCSFSARVGLFLGLYANKTPRGRSPATVLLILPVIMLHFHPHSDAVMVLCVMNGKAL